MYINITLKENIRNLRKDSLFSFNFDKDFYKIIVGDNGSGKSTLINIIRSYQCDNKSDKEANDYDLNLGYGQIDSFKDKVNIETDFNKFYFLSSEFDNPISLDNSASADSFIAHGGFASYHKSNGERNLYNLGKWLKENETQFDKNTLILFDEVDAGFDLRYQVGLINMINKLHNLYNCKFIIITHNVIPILISELKEVYYFNIKKEIFKETYLVVQTGYKINIEKL